MNDLRHKLLLTGAKIALLVGAVTLAYWPARHGCFIMDDDVLITQNPLIKAPTGWYRFWTTEAVDYWPVTNDAFWLEWRIWGMNPAGYRAVNIILHIASSLLIWRILLRLQIPGAYLAALLFAVHPINVQSVAWIAELKNELSLSFGLLSILSYLKSNYSFNRWYWFSLACFVLGALSKGSVLILPLVLLLIRWWQRERMTKRFVYGLAPFFLLATALSIVNVWFQTHGADVAVRKVTFDQRLAGAGAVVWFYLEKSLFPIQLAFVYPQWNIDTSQLRWWIPLVAAFLLSVILIWGCARTPALWVRSLLFAWAVFCVALLPVLGFRDVGFMRFSLVGDHYQQIALIAIVAGIGALISKLIKGLTSRRRSADRLAISIVIFAAPVVLLAFLTYRRATLYRDAVDLYQAAIVENPDGALLYNNLGVEYLSSGRTEDAVAEFSHSLELDSENPEARTGMGYALTRLGQMDEATKYFNQALQIAPGYVPALTDFAKVLLDQHHADRAVELGEKAIKFDPDNTVALINLSVALIQSGNAEEAIAHLKHVLEIDERSAEAHFNLGLALANLGSPDAAIQQCQQALSIKPDYAEAHAKLGDLFAATGQLSLAYSHCEQAIKLRPDESGMHYDYGLLLAANGQLAAAIEQFQTSLRLDPNNSDTRQHLGIALAMADRLPEAISMFEGIIKSDPNDFQAFFNLAMAYGRMNRRDEAIATAKKAIAIARSQNENEAVGQIDQWIKSYRNASQSDH